MDELISKMAVVEAIEKARANVGHNLERSIGKSIIEILDDVGRDVNRLPPAEPKRGKWVEHSTGYLMCDQCKDVYINPEWLADGHWSFCPNCGSYNGGEQNETY